MDQKILNHFLEFSTYTYPGLYKDRLTKDLPDNIREIGLLVRKSLIHRTTLEAGNVGTNADLRFGDMTKMPWWRQPEDDILITAAAMLTELYHRDERGFILNREPKDKLVLTCRFTAVLVASILKSKGIPSVCRAGHTSYFHGDNQDGATKISWDHWLNQYWNETEKRFITIDVDGSLSLAEDFDPYDVPSGKFDFSAKAWLDIRSGKDRAERFYNSDGNSGLMVVLWSLFYDFHCLMNNEIIYQYGPICGYGNPNKFKNLTEEELKRVDSLANLMLDPYTNLNALKKIWETEKDFRLLKGSLL